MTATQMAPAATGNRMHGLDALRAIALALGIVLHSMLPYAVDIPWLFKDSQSTPAADFSTYWIHLFRMVVFMMLAGYFGHLILRRRGAWPYLRDRLIRIGLPLVVFWPIAVLPLGLLWVLFYANHPIPEDQVQLQESAAAASPSMLSINVGHLWFLLVLLEVILIVLVVRALLLAALGQKRLVMFSDLVGRILSSPAGVVCAAVPYFVCVLLQGSGHVQGITEPMTLRPSVTALVAYGGAFLVGWFLNASEGAMKRVGHQWPVQLLVAVAATVIGYVLPVGQVPLPLHAAAIAVAGWSWTYAAIGLCLALLAKENRIIRYLSDSSYWIYLLHLPLVVGVGMVLADLPWPVVLKLLIVWLVTFAVLLLTYDLLVRGTWVGRWLNGRRRPRVLLAGKIRPQRPRLLDPGSCSSGIIAGPGEWDRR